MDKKPFITNDEPLEIALNFEKLRSKGLRFIEELAGEFWTDYNSHDPGITILEQLCYAITELAYRTECDIKDLLKADIADDVSSHPLLLKPQEIFPCNALTIEDYRKLIFDANKHVKNVWLIPLKNKDHTLNGLYRILIDVDSTVQTEKEKNEVIEQVTNIFYEHRNMGEDIESVEILEHIEVVVTADVEVDGTRSLEQILAEIFSQIQEYLNPKIQFFSMAELLAKGKNIQEIYTGPLLKHGFIPDEELKAKPSRVLVSEITKMMMDVKGVLNIKNMLLLYEGKVETNQILIPENKLLQLSPRVRTTSGDFSIKFFRNNIPYRSIDEEKVLRILNEIRSMSHRAYRLTEESIEAPKGQALALEDYYSIQNQFPSIYGIGKEGVPYGADAQRRSMAKQLKGYLLLFEQIMTNYLAQLSNAKKLFSISHELSQTYFAQSLAHIHNVQSLLRNEPMASFSVDSVGHEPIPAMYEQAIHHITKTFDNYHDRRNRFLNWLLSLNGEEFLAYSPSQFNYYFTEEEFQEYLILQKIRFLKLLPIINANRSKAFNYRADRLAKGNMNGLETKISLLLGFNIIEEESQQVVEMSLVSPYKEWDYTLRGEEDEELLQEWFDESRLEKWGLSPEIIEKHFDMIDKDDILPIKDVFNDKNQLARYLTPTVSLKTKLLPVSLLIGGIHLSRFRIGTHPEKDDLTTVVFWDENRSKWWKIADYDDIIEASTAVALLNKHFKEINLRCEGLHLIEHILLRPHREEVAFGFYLLDEEKNRFLATEKVTNFYQRTAEMELVEKEIGQYERYSVEITREKNFVIIFTSSSGLRLNSTKSYISVQEVHDKMERLFHYLSDKDDIVPFEKKVLRYIKLKNQPNCIPEYFFSFRMSIALPNWTARFTNPEFRSIVEETIHKYHPTHISSNCYWLKPQEMEILENTYYVWMDAKMKGDANLDKHKEYLTWILYRLYCGENFV